MMDEKNMPPPPAPDDNDDEDMSQENKLAIERAGRDSWFFLVSNPLCLSSSSARHFYDHSFLVHNPVNRDDQHRKCYAPERAKPDLG
jgi:hypothetical protein